MESVGVSVALSVVAPTTVGVHEHVARPAVVATAVHAVMFVEPLTKAIFPAVVAIAEIVTGFPYFAVVTEPGRERATVGVAFETVRVTVAVVEAGVADESMAVIVCVYVPTGRFRGALRRSDPVGVTDNVSKVMRVVSVSTAGVT